MDTDDCWLPDRLPLSPAVLDVPAPFFLLRIHRGDGMPPCPERDHPRIQIMDLPVSIRMLRQIPQTLPNWRATYAGCAGDGRNPIAAQIPVWRWSRKAASAAYFSRTPSHRPGCKGMTDPGSSPLRCSN